MTGESSEELAFVFLEQCDEVLPWCSDLQLQELGFVGGHRLAVNFDRGVHEVLIVQTQVNVTEILPEVID